MSLLNRYILKKFLRPFFASFVTLCLIIFVSQLFERLDRFLGSGVNWGHVFGYLLTSLPFYALQMLPVACLLGTLFVIGDLARNREYIAGLAAGLGPEKFLGGLLWAGAMISVFGLLINETVVPPATRYATKVFQEKIRRIGDFRDSVIKDLQVSGTEGRMWSLKQLDQSTGVMTRVIVDTYKTGLLVSQLDAPRATWHGDGWTFEDGYFRTFETDGATIKTSDKFKEKTYPWEERPSDFVLQEPQPEQMNYRTLKEHIYRLESLGVPARELKVELAMKLAFPVSCFIVTILGVPLALKGGGKKAMGIASAALFALLYMGFIQFGKAMAQRLVTPFVGAWLGNAVFLTAALILWVRMRRTV